MKDTVEWFKCMFSKKHAKKTKLRITEAKEKSMLESLDIIAILIFMLLLFNVANVWYRYQELQVLKNSDRTIIQVELENE